MARFNYELYIRKLFDEVREEYGNYKGNICIEIEMTDDRRTSRTYRVSTEEASTEVVVYKDAHRRWGAGMKYAREALDAMVEEHIDALPWI